MKEREQFIDIGKGIAIVLVVYVHSGLAPTWILPWINQFYMPFFFIVSGYINGKNLKLKTARDMWSYVLKLIRIYFFTCFILFAIRIFLKLIFERTFEIEKNFLYSVLFGRFFDENNPSLSDWCWTGHMWFLTAMIVTIALSYCIIHIADEKILRYIITVVILLVFAQLWRKASILMPWCIDITPTLCIYYLCGYGVGRKDVLNGRFTFSWGMVDIVLTILFVVCHSNYDIHVRNYGTYGGIIAVIMFISSGISGSLLLLRLCRYIEQVPLISNGLSFCGQESLSIFRWHILGIFTAQMTISILWEDNISNELVALLLLIFVVVFSIAFENVCKVLRKRIISSKY